MKCFASNDLLRAKVRPSVFNHAFAASRPIRRAMVWGLWRYLYQRQSAIDEGIEGSYAFHPIWFNNPRYRGEVNLTDLRDRIGT